MPIVVPIHLFLFFFLLFLLFLRLWLRCQAVRKISALRTRRQRPRVMQRHYLLLQRSRWSRGTTQCSRRIARHTLRRRRRGRRHIINVSLNPPQHSSLPRRRRIRSIHLHTQRYTAVIVIALAPRPRGRCRGKVDVGMRARNDSRKHLQLIAAVEEFRTAAGAAS